VLPAGGEGDSSVTGGQRGWAREKKTNNKGKKQIKTSFRAEGEQKNYPRKSRRKKGGGRTKERGKKEGHVRNRLMGKICHFCHQKKKKKKGTAKERSRQGHKKGVKILSRSLNNGKEVERRGRSVGNSKLEGGNLSGEAQAKKKSKCRISGGKKIFWSVLEDNVSFFWGKKEWG